MFGEVKATRGANGQRGQVGLCRVFIAAAKSDLGLTGPLSAVGARDAVVVTLLGPQPAFGSWAEARLCAHVMICSVQHMKIHLRRVLFCLCLYYTCFKSRFFEGTSVNSLMVSPSPLGMPSAASGRGSGGTWLGLWDVPAPV